MIDTYSMFCESKLHIDNYYIKYRLKYKLKYRLYLIVYLLDYVCTLKFKNWRKYRLYLIVYMLIRLRLRPKIKKLSPCTPIIHRFLKGKIIVVVENNPMIPKLSNFQTVIPKSTRKNLERD